MFFSYQKHAYGILISIIEGSKMKILKVAIVLLIVITMCSCASVLITMNQLDSIQKGMSPEEVNILLLTNPDGTYSLMSNDIEYFVEIYTMQTGVSTGSSYSPGFNGAPGAFTTYSIPYGEDYLLIYAEEKLIYWGFIQEINKAEDTEIMTIADDINIGYTTYIENIKMRNNYE